MTRRARLPLLIALSAAGCCAQTSLAVVPARGLDFVHRHSPTAQKFLIETMGGGLALFDYNNDGRLDLFLVNGGRLTEKSPGDFARGLPLYWNRLYRQNADGSFTDVTSAAGLHRSGNVYGMGAAAGDFDNDGWVDLYITNYGANQLWRNNGNGTFTDVTAAAGVAGGDGWSVSAGFLDYDNDGRLDLFAARYLDWSLSRNILCGAPFHTYCRPDHFEGTTNLLFHNEGGGRFRDASEASGIAKVKGKGMGIAFHDYDSDGFADIFVANDGMEQFLFRNRGDGTFEERGLEAGVALSDDAKSYAGMGVAFADYNNDGRADVLVTNLALEKYALYRNEGGGRFSYASLSTGLAPLTANHSGWGVGFADFDNDGHKDLFAAQSHVLDNVERVHAGLRYLELPALLRNLGGGRGFEAAPIGGLLRPVAGRGVAFGDLNNDGAIDAVMTVLGGSPVVLLNRTRRPGLTLRLEGTASNRSGLGAVVEGPGGQSVYATAAGSYLASSDPRVHLAGRSGPITVRWPSGVRQELDALLPAAGGPAVVTIREPAKQ